MNGIFAGCRLRINSIVFPTVRISSLSNRWNREDAGVKNLTGCLSKFIRISLFLSKLSGLPGTSGCARTTCSILGIAGPEFWAWFLWAESERVRLSFPVLVLCERQVRLVCACKLRDLSKLAWQPMQTYVMRTINGEWKRKKIGRSSAQQFNRTIQGLDNCRGWLGSRDRVVTMFGMLLAKKSLPKMISTHLHSFQLEFWRYKDGGEGADARHLQCWRLWVLARPADGEYLWMKREKHLVVFHGLSSKFKKSSCSCYY